jgi:hypothetical protein
LARVAPRAAIGDRGRSATKYMRYLLILLLTQISVFAQVSTEQQNDFLARLDSALSKNSIDQFMHLGYTVGLSEKLLSSSHKQAETTLSVLAPRREKIIFEWRVISEQELKEMKDSLKQAGYDFNLTPVTNLKIIIPADSRKDPRIPSDITFALGLYEDQLYRVGTIKNE